MISAETLYGSKERKFRRDGRQLDSEQTLKEKRVSSPSKQLIICHLIVAQFTPCLPAQWHSLRNARNSPCASGNSPATNRSRQDTQDNGTTIRSQRERNTFNCQKNKLLQVREQ